MTIGARPTATQAGAAPSVATPTTRTDAGPSPTLLGGVDVGGSKIAVLVADAGLRPVARLVAPMAPGDARDGVRRIVAALDEALAAAGHSRGELAAVGTGVPGRVDPEAGTVTLAVNLGWHALPLRDELEGTLGVPVAVENDVRAAAAGLHARGQAAGVDNLAYLAIGTGISAGVVLDGRLYRGPRGLAGEIGHIVLEPNGPACRCGLDGCLEALASGRAIAEAAALRIEQDPGSSIESPVSAESVYRAAAAGDPVATRLAERTGRYVARAIHALVMTYDVPRVVLGGGVTRAGAAFLDPVTRGLDELRAASALAREALPDDLVELLPPDADSGAWGGVILARGVGIRPTGPSPGGPPDGRR
jgi:predicted NBD/HSP70 family sugar kinase